MIQTETQLPAGARLLTEVVDALTEKRLYDEIEGVGWQHLGCARAVQEYGYNYHFRRCGTDKYKQGLVFRHRESYTDYIQSVGFGHEIDAGTCPGFVGEFMALVALELSQPVNQIIVNRYLPGEGIKNHRDTDMPCSWFCSLSLGAGIVLKFVSSTDPEDRLGVWLPPRSLLMVEGPAFFDYKHGISHKKNDGDTPRGPRISLTGRYLSPDQLR